MMSQQIFTREIMLLVDDYIRDNDWVTQWGKVGGVFHEEKSWKNKEIMSSFIQAAYKLYRSSPVSAFGFILLGGTAIRTDPNYIKSFGVTAANGIQDEAAQKIVDEELAKRVIFRTKVWDTKQKTDPFAKVKDFERLTKLEAGAILSEKNWTPILNDSLIIGGVTHHREFILALTPGEQAAWGRENYKHAKSPAEAKSQWLAFMQKEVGSNTTEGMFIGPWGPRVLARELLGLKFFGYYPVFDTNQLSFFRVSAGSIPPGNAPTFSAYLRGLREVEFQVPNNLKILRALGEFLFQDVNVLTPQFIHQQSVDAMHAQARAYAFQPFAAITRGFRN
jgi:hypothetical protein